MSGPVFSRMTGTELRLGRKAAGLSQAQLAAAAGIGRQAVSYWENKSVLCGNGWACRRMFEALGISIPPVSPFLTRARGDGVLFEQVMKEHQRLARISAATKTREASDLAHLRVLCGAMTRKGQPCRLLSEPGHKRCKFHGGRSTGPRTPAGRAKIAEAQRQRRAAWRAQRYTIGHHSP